MIWKIAQKEFLLNVMTFKFAAGTIVCVVLSAVFVPLLAKDYQQRVRAYRDNVARNQAALQKVTVYKNIAPTIFRPPSVLSVFSEGLEKRVGDSATIELDKVPEISAAAAQGNPYQTVFPIFDTSLIFRIVLSILALLVAYDAISGERERGTLKLMLCGTTRRSQVLLAKLVAGLLVLVVPVTITFALGLLILLFFPMVDLTLADTARIVLMYLASLIFVSAMYNVGLLFSSLARQSPLSLVLGLFLWIVFAIVIPNGSVYLAAEMRPPESQEKIDGQMLSLRQEYADELSRNKPRRPSDTSESGTQDALGRWYLRLLNRSYLEYIRECNRLEYPLKVQYADKFWEVERGYLNSLVEQRYLADRLSRLSPISLYDSVMTALAGTDMAASHHFMDGVRAYRADIMEYVRDRTEGFSSPSFFTPCTYEEADEYERFLMQAQQAKSQAEIAALSQAAEALREKVSAETRSLNLQDLPVFAVPGALGGLARAVPDLALLVFVNVLFFALSFLAFMKYDVR